MIEPKDPPRLFESHDAPAELRDLIRQAHDDGLSPLASKALILCFEERLTSAETLDLDPKGLGAPKWGSLSMKILAPIAAVGVGLGGWLAAEGTFTRRATSESAVAQETTPIASDGPINRHRAERDQLSPSNEQQGASESHRVDVPESNRALLPNLPSRTNVGTEDAKIRVPSKHRPEASSPPKTTEPATDEYSLLAAARRALRNAPAQAIRLVDEHARHYPRGMLSQEREAIAIEALLAMGQLTQAQHRAERFYRAYPGSPHQTRIEAALRRHSAAESRP